MTRQPGVLSSLLLGSLLFSVLKGWSLTFCSLLTDEEMMATEVAPSTMTELTDLGKCLMKHEVGGGAGEGFLLSRYGASFHFSQPMMPSKNSFG